MATFLITACSNENDEELIFHFHNRYTERYRGRKTIPVHVRGLQVMANSTGHKMTD